MKSVDTTLETVGGMLRRETETENVKKKNHVDFISHRRPKLIRKLSTTVSKKKTKNLLLDLNIFISLIDNVGKWNYRWN